MAKAKKVEKLNFSKFFPESTSYVTVTGQALGSDDFCVNVRLGDGDNSITLFTNEWYKGDSLSTLKAIQEGVTKAIEFQQKALKLPKVQTPELWSVWENEPAKMKPAKRVLKSTETAVKKKAVKK